ncbi:MAG: hypothetical protein V4709_14005 [Pseudomonadota bacterium]
MAVVGLRTLRELDFAAASGLALAHDALWVIADDGLQLHRLSLSGAPLARHDLFPGQAALPIEPKPRKKAKPDLEALCALPDGRLLALGSGSRRNRARCSLFDPVTHETRLIDAAPLYDSLEVDLPELNIEGACVFGNTLVLSHRGNSEGASDALVLLDWASILASLADGTLAAAARLALIPLQLGEIDGARLTLTDLATDHAGQLCYSAAAEVTEDRYDDGPCAGSVIGRFDAAFQPAQQWRLPGHFKVEGLACPGTGEWLLVADADDPEVPSPLLRFTLS